MEDKENKLEEQNEVKQSEKEEKTFSYDYVKELRDEAKKYRLKAKELEEQLNKFKLEIENERSELLIKIDNLTKELNEVKPKAESLENKIKESLLSQIPDEELRKKAIEKYKDIEQLEFYVNSLKELTKNNLKPSSMDTSNKQTSVETEYLQALKAGDIKKAISLKNKLYKIS